MNRTIPERIVYTLVWLSVFIFGGLFWTLTLYAAWAIIRSIAVTFGFIDGSFFVFYVGVTAAALIVAFLSYLRRRK